MLHQYLFPLVLNIVPSLFFVVHYLFFFLLDQMNPLWIIWSGTRDRCPVIISVTKLSQDKMTLVSVGDRRTSPSLLFGTVHSPLSSCGSDIFSLDSRPND